MPATCNNSLQFEKHFVKVFHGIFAVFIYFLNISAVRATGSTGKLKNIFYRRTEHYSAGGITDLYAVTYAL